MFLMILIMWSAILPLLGLNITFTHINLIRNTIKIFLKYI